MLTAMPADTGIFLTCFRYDYWFLAALARGTGIRLLRAETVEQADFLLTVTGAQVLLCDAVFLDGTWRDCADMLGWAHPRVSLVVLADPVDAPFVAGAVERGACGVSFRPIGFPLRDLVAAARDAACDRALLAGVPG